MLTVDKFSTETGLEQLAPNWNRLLADSNANQITLTWEWMMSWWEVFGDGRELYLLGVRDGDELIGLAPFLRRSVTHYGLLPYKRLEFLASGEDEADEICSPYLDFIFRRGREADALEAVFHYLREHQKEWDEIVLTDLSAQSPNLANLQILCDGDHGVRYETVRSQAAVFISLASEWESYLATLSSSTRWKIRRDRRAIDEKNGECRIIKSAEGFTENFEILVRLHQERWTTDGKPGAFASEKFTRFHRLLAERILPLGWIRLYVVLISGEPIAAIYDFVYNGKEYFYQIGRTAETCAVHSPGMLTQGYAIENAIIEGLSEYELFKGGSNSYKFHWSDQTRELLQLRLIRSNSKEALYSAATKVAGRLREFKMAVAESKEGR